MTDHTPPLPETTSTPATTAGIASAILASSCCVLPVALAAAGLGGLGLGAFFGEYHWYFFAAGAVALVVGWGLHLRQRQSCLQARCEVAGGRRARLSLIAGTLMVAGFGALNAYTGAARPPAPAGEPGPAGLAQAVLPVEGMTCFSCALTVEGSLKEVAGVAGAEASVPGKSVTVRYEAAKVGIADLVEAVNRTGFRARAPETGAS